MVETNAGAQASRSRATLFEGSDAVAGLAAAALTQRAPQRTSPFPSTVASGRMARPWLTRCSPRARRTLDGCSGGLAE